MRSMTRKRRAYQSSRTPSDRADPAGVFHRKSRPVDGVRLAAVSGIARRGPGYDLPLGLRVRCKANLEADPA
jgi:hypothetical protein